ncbi:MAG: tripartite tricarboxylate transporter substrate binding protein [Rhizobiales bacterium]|nr:tripartite tricarboxylate transporter substrate binding protein [Hyphomicrobiales bacterium]
MPTVHALMMKAAGVLLALTTAAAAQDYPTKPVRLIVPFPPGGFNDIVARMIGTQLSDRLGKQVVVDNRTGAGGVVGTELAAHAPNDGYTLLIASLAITINPWFHKTSYDAVKSFAPVALLATAPNVISIQPDLPLKSVKDLIAMAKERPGKLQYASAGVGSFMHMGPELFKQMAKVDILHVPFRGAGPALIDVMGGNTHMSFASVPSSITHFRSSKLRALGVGSLKRNGLIPDVPTIDESGLPGYEFSNWIGIVAPAGTPAAIVTRLHKDLSAIQDSPELKKQFANEGAEAVRMSSAEYGKFIASETARWGRVVKKGGIKPQ